MEGVGSITNSEGATRTASKQEATPSSPGALETGRNEIAKALGVTGFVHVVGPSSENFQTYLTREPFEIEVGELKPGMLVELEKWVASEFSGDPDEVLQIQANVDPERAVALLT